MNDLELIAARECPKCKDLAAKVETLDRLAYLTYHAARLSLTPQESDEWTALITKWKQDYDNNRRST